MDDQLRFRQVHLDFHTSEHIGGVGSEFDAERFAWTLQAAAVDSVTCFSRCHHGWIYHETALPYRHPSLSCNLLVEQVRACHRLDIRVPVYVTVGWDQLQGRLHPEWVEVDISGSLGSKAPLEDGWGWFKMDFASRYVEYLVDQVEEVCELLGDELDGFFFDILYQRGVHSQACLERFGALGWDPRDDVRQVAMRRLLVEEVVSRLTSAVRGRNRDCSLFFNSGHVGPQIRGRLGDFSHLELESLPTGGWGYMHFPVTARYARTLGKEFLGMTGKFSESWGHFGSYKNARALEYECFSALALGGKCSVGDQLPPSGVLDAATYDLIGGVYSAVREVEPWCRGARGLAEVAVLSAEVAADASDRIDPRNLGLARMLMEGRHQFDFVDYESDWSLYPVLVLPDSLRVKDQGKLASYRAGGGRLVAFGESILTEDGDVGEVFREVVSSCSGDSAFCPEYLRPTSVSGLRAGVDHVVYERGLSLSGAPGVAVLGTVTEPFFNRSWERFCSHAHTPPGLATERPAVLVGEGVAVFAHPLASSYALHSATVYRELFLGVLRRFLPVALVEMDGPSSLQAHLTRQGSRLLLHLLHYVPERRGLTHDIVEDAMAILAGEVRVRTELCSASVVPTGERLEARREGDVLVVSHPGGMGRLMICLE